MVTIAHLTKKIIEQRPFFQEALAKGIINYGSLADLILPEIKKELKKEVKHSAVMMALRREAERLEKTVITTIKFSKDTEITIKSNLIEITVQKTPGLLKRLEKLYKYIEFEKGDMLSVTQGSIEVTIVTNSKYKDKLYNVFDKENIVSEIENIASLSINIPENAVDEYGLFYIVARALTWENIPIIELVSTFREMILILNEDDVTQAFKVMQNLIKEQGK